MKFHRYEYKGHNLAVSSHPSTLLIQQINTESHDDNIQHTKNPPTWFTWTIKETILRNQCSIHLAKMFGINIITESTIGSTPLAPQYWANHEKDKYFTHNKLTFFRHRFLIFGQHLFKGSDVIDHLAVIDLDTTIGKLVLTSGRILLCQFFLEAGMGLL